MFCYSNLYIFCTLSSSISSRIIRTRNRLLGFELAIFHIRLIDTGRTSAEKLNRGQCATLLTRGISIVPPRPTDYLSFPPGLICQLSNTSIASLWSSNERPFKIEMDTLCARVLIFCTLLIDNDILSAFFFLFFEI